MRGTPHTLTPTVSSAWRPAQRKSYYILFRHYVTFTFCHSAARLVTIDPMGFKGSFHILLRARVIKIM